MYQIATGIEVFFYKTAVDFRKSFDGLCGVVNNEMEMNPLSGSLYVFHNKRCNSLKLLQWEGDGFSLYYKRLEKGTFEIPQSKDTTCEITSEQLSCVLSGIELSSIKKRKRYKMVA
jgi:transposase